MEEKDLSNLKYQHVSRSQRNLWQRSYIWKSESIEFEVFSLSFKYTQVTYAEKPSWSKNVVNAFGVKNACFLLSASSFSLQYLWFLSVGKMLLKVRIGRAEVLRRTACWTWNCFTWLNNNNFSYFKQRYFFFKIQSCHRVSWHNTKPWWSPKWWLTMWGKCMGILTNQGIY